MPSLIEIVVFAAPIVAFAALRRSGLAFLASYPIGVLLLWRTMIANEAAAPDSDLDVVFALALIVWAALLALLYAAILLAVQLLVALGRYVASAMARRRPTAPRQ